VPPRLVRLARSASGHLADKWEELRASPTYGAAVSRANELARSASDATAPHLDAALSKGRALTRAASEKFSQVQAELTDVVDKQMRATPALETYADPVVVQAVVASILGAPLLLLLPLLSALFGRRGGGGAAAAGGQATARRAGGAKKSTAKAALGKGAGR
jgi:hypothetical protein